MDIFWLSVFGFATVAVILTLVIRNLEAAIFWSALAAPAVGSSLIAALEHFIAGNAQQAVESLKLLPFFMASLDKAFFTQEDPVYTYVGFGFVFIWAYLISHYAVKKFKMWALPIVPTILWGIGLTMPDMREKLMTMFPNIAILFSFYGIPALILISTIIFLICYFIWRRGYVIERLPMYIPPSEKGR